MKIEDEIKSNFKNEHHKALVNLFYTSSRIGDIMNERLKPHGITPQQYNVLRILRGQYPKTASVSLIKERVLEKNADISRILDRLINKKLIERKEQKKDRRQKAIKITNAGLSLLSSLDSATSSSDILNILTGLEAETLNTLLNKIRENKLFN